MSLITTTTIQVTNSTTIATTTTTIPTTMAPISEDWPVERIQ